MKSKLRKITIDDSVYRYSLSEKYIAHGGLGEGGFYLTKLKVFKGGYKNTPLEIRFQNIDGYAIGNPITHELGDFNLNKPSVVEKLIRIGLSLVDWDWEKTAELLDGMKLLEKMGIDTSELKSDEIPPRIS